jgi:hypothetical protein
MSLHPKIFSFAVKGINNQVHYTVIEPWHTSVCHSQIRLKKKANSDGKISSIPADVVCGI